MAGCPILYPSRAAVHRAVDLMMCTTMCSSAWCCKLMIRMRCLSGSCQSAVILSRSSHFDGMSKIIQPDSRLMQTGPRARGSSSWHTSNRAFPSCPASSLAGCSRCRDLVLDPKTRPITESKPECDPTSQPISTMWPDENTTSLRLTASPHTVSLTPCFVFGCGRNQSA